MPMFNKRWPAVIVFGVSTLAVPPLLDAQMRGAGPEGSVGSGHHSGSAATGQYGTSGTGTTPRSGNESTVTVDDQALMQNIRQALQADPALEAAARSVTLVIKDGDVALTGAVKNDKEKADIGKRVQNVAGVKSVENQLQTAPNLGGTTSGTAGDPTERQSPGAEMDDRGSMLDDASGRAHFRAMSASDTHLQVERHPLLVMTAADEVTRERYDDDRSREEFVSQAARDLVKRVRANLEANPKTADLADDVRIGAGMGVVTLQGEVTSERDRDRLLAATRAVKGVKRVRDRLRVTTSADATDDAADDRSAAAAVTTPDPRYGSGVGETYRPATGFPATGARGMRAAGDDATAGSGSMDEEDRTGSTGPSGTSSYSSTDTGAIDATARAAKPAGDYATTTNDRGVAARVRTMVQGDPALGVTDDSLHIIVDNGDVTLRGWIQNDQQREAINARVREIPGVQSVRNEMLLRSGAVSSK